MPVSSTRLTIRLVPRRIRNTYFRCHPRHGKPHLNPRTLHRRLNCGHSFGWTLFHQYVSVRIFHIPFIHHASLRSDTHAVINGHHRVPAFNSSNLIRSVHAPDNIRVALHTFRSCPARPRLEYIRAIWSCAYGTYPGRALNFCGMEACLVSSGERVMGKHNCV